MNPTVFASPALLSAAHQRIYDKIFQHPLCHSLPWREIRALLPSLGRLVESPNGNLLLTCQARTHLLQASTADSMISTVELVKLRHFLTHPETAAPENPEAAGHFLVVLNHHDARVYRSELHGALPQRIVPHDQGVAFHHGQASGDFSRGREKPAQPAFFAALAAALQGAVQILVFGSGTGTSSEMEQFRTWLTQHHADLAHRVIGFETVDEHHLTEPQLLARARDFYLAQSGRPKSAN